MMDGWMGGCMVDQQLDPIITELRMGYFQGIQSKDALPSSSLCPSQDVTPALWTGEAQGHTHLHTSGTGCIYIRDHDVL